MNSILLIKIICGSNCTENNFSTKNKIYRSKDFGFNLFLRPLLLNIILNIHGINDKMILKTCSFLLNILSKFL